MSTGKRLAKRSIIGTRVCAPGEDGKYYSGVIHAVKTPASAASESGLSITPKTRYSVRFDSVPGGRPPSPSTEYSDRDLIGPGFGSVTSARLVPGQKVYLTYNGREIHAEVTQHREHLDEVDVIIAPTGQETMRLTKRIDEVRLLESRKSARLADQDTDFARLADMAGDRKRASSHSIDVPHVIGSRKRRPSSSNDSERSYSGWNERIPHGCGREGCRTNERGDCMDECTAALVLMSLSCSPHSPHNPLPLHCQHNYGSWGGRGGGGGGMVVGSPGVGGTSNSSSSSSGASWRSGTPSPPLSDEGAPTTGSLWPTSAHPSHNQQHYPYNASGSSSSSTPGSTITLDEGIVPDYLEEQHPRKKKIRAKVNRDPVENGPGNSAIYESEQVFPMHVDRRIFFSKIKEVTRWTILATRKLETSRHYMSTMLSKQLHYINTQISKISSGNLLVVYRIVYRNGMIRRYICLIHISLFEIITVVSLSVQENCFYLLEKLNSKIKYCSHDMHVSLIALYRE